MTARCAVALALCSCAAAPGEPDRARSLTIVTDRAAEVWTLGLDRRIEPRARATAGTPIEVDLGSRGANATGLPLFLRSPDGTEIALVDASAGPRIEVRATDWKEQDAAAQRAFARARAGVVEPGMQRFLVMLAWGIPASVPSASRGNLGTSEIWQYVRDGRDVLVYLVDDYVERIRRL